MQTSVLKYVWIAIFFLALGGETMMRTSSHNVLVMPALSSTTEVGMEIQDSWQASNEVYTMVLDTFSSICQVEAFKLAFSGQEKDFVRIIRIRPWNFSTFSTQNVVKNNFMRLLTERHCNGFYLYTLKKLII